MVIKSHLCVPYGFRTNSNFALNIINRVVFINELDSVYCAVRTEYLCNTDTSPP